MLQLYAHLQFRIHKQRVCYGMVKKDVIGKVISYCITEENSLQSLANL